MAIQLASCHARPTLVCSIQNFVCACMCVHVYIRTVHIPRIVCIHNPIQHSIVFQSTYRISMIRFNDRIFFMWPRSISSERETITTLQCERGHASAMLRVQVTSKLHVHKGRTRARNLHASLQTTDKPHCNG